LVILAVLQFVSAAETGFEDNNYESQDFQTMDVSPSAAAGLLALFGGMYLFFIIIGIIGTVFFIISLINILTANNDTNWKLLWGLVVFFGGIIGIIVYYIVGKKSRIAEGGMQKNSFQPTSQQSAPVFEDPKVAQLRSYVNRARAAGKTDEQIKNELRKTGWPDSLINQAFQ
jgi:hypothetical protein